MLWAPDPFNRRTGKLLGYNYYQKFSEYDPEKGGDYFRRTMRQPGKKMLTEEGQAFANWIKGLGEEVDPLTPWLIKQFKDGNVGLSGDEIWVKSNSGDTQTVPVQAAKEVFEKFATWYNATDSPHRQGKNIQEMTLEDVNTAAAQHHAWVEQQQREEERKQEVREIFDGNDQQTVYEWPDGWTVKQLFTTEDLQNETAAMKHCIGEDNQPYCQALMDESIEVFSLRDPEGMPHATWHYNPDGSLAQIQGFQGHSPKEEYMERFEQWAASAGRDTDPVGDQDYFDDEFTLQINNLNMFDVVFGGDDYLRDVAIGEGANFNPEGYGDERIDIEINWNDVVQDMLDRMPDRINQKQEEWMNEWGRGAPNYYHERKPEAPDQLKLFNEYEDGTSLEEINWHQYPRDRDGLPIGESSVGYSPVKDIVDTIYASKEKHRDDIGDWDPESLIRELDQAIREFVPQKGWTEQTKQTYVQLTEEWDQVRHDFSDPNTFDSNMKARPNDPSHWPDFMDIETYDPEELPRAEWESDPTNVPPLWIDDRVIGEEGIQAIPWWDSESQRYLQPDYSEETTDPELTDARKLWNLKAQPKAAAEINQWGDLDKPDIDPQQKVLPGMCPNCGSADYEIGWEFPTKTIQNKWDMESQVVDPSHPFGSGWYFYCPDCGYYEGYTGPAAKAREEQLPHLEDEPGYKWDSRAQRFRRLNPDPIEDPLLYSVDQKRYERAKRNYEDSPRYRWRAEPKIEDYVNAISRGRGAPSADKSRQDPFYNWAKDLVQDTFDANPNVNIKQPNFKSILKRNVQGVRPDDYTSQSLIEFAETTDQLSELQQAANEAAQEIDAVLSVAPNYLGKYPDECKCPKCNRQRGQRQRHKRPIAVKVWKELIKGDLSGNYRASYGNDVKQWDDYWTAGVKRFIKKRGWEDLNERQVMAQINKYQPTDQELRNAPFGNGNIYEHWKFDEALEVQHDYYDWHQQWHDYFVSIGLAKEEDPPGSAQAWGKFRTLDSLKRRAESISEEVEELKNPSTPSDPS